MPANWSDTNYKLPNEAPCIIDSICSTHVDMVTDVKYVKEYTWKMFVENLFQQKILRGNGDNFTKILTSANFDANLKGVTKFYEQQLLNKGGFDERIFLGK